MRRLVLLIVLSQHVCQIQSSPGLHDDGDESDDFAVVNVAVIKDSLKEIRDGVRALVKNTPGHQSEDALSDLRIRTGFQSVLEYYANNTCQTGVQEMKENFNNFAKEIKESLETTEENILASIKDLKDILNAKKMNSRDARCNNKVGEPLHTIRLPKSDKTFLIYQKNGRGIDGTQAREVCSDRGMILASFKTLDHIKELCSVLSDKGSECWTSGKEQERSGNKIFYWQTGELVDPTLLLNKDPATPIFSKQSADRCINISNCQLAVSVCTWRYTCVICEEPDYC
ncbi:uncharacterized protein LOC132205090 isoform X1 [Neocloeon triangulifer]|uniref:uncharacterized protein LOC132205090 isoform X1 n=1 Tax=Neocloeon triangulifer TaxID=2078957 RepID=UPI00286EE4A2|nr:uncharacterized protein LOC132205090 isoform X1 [Neocloeon triangulifer]XP_059489934.1 uncharacterized protein LOC132205090 isoform X1 [Neocloeon triangulifer]